MSQNNKDFIYKLEIEEEEMTIEGVIEDSRKFVHKSLNEIGYGI